MHDYDSGTADYPATPYDNVGSGIALRKLQTVLQDIQKDLRDRSKTEAISISLFNYLNKPLTAALLPIPAILDYIDNSAPV